MKNGSNSIIQIDQSSRNIKFLDSSEMKKQQQTVQLLKENDAVERLSQIDNVSQSMNSSSISHKNLAGILRSLSKEKTKEEQSDKSEKSYEQSQTKIQRKPIEENQRKCLLELIEKNNKNGRHNKKMTQQLIPDLESKIEQNNQNQKRMRLQEQQNKKYAIIGFKAYQMQKKEKVELLQIIEQYKQPRLYFNAEPKKKLLIFIYQLIYLIESVKLLSIDQCTLQQIQIMKQMRNRKQQNIKSQYQKYEIMGNQIFHMVDKQKQQLVQIIKQEFNKNNISPIHRSLVFSQILEIFKIIQSKERQSSLSQTENKQVKDNRNQQLIQKIINNGQQSIRQIKSMFSKIIAIILLFILRLFD